MKKNFKRIAAALLSATLLVTFGACGAKNDNTSGSNTSTGTTATEAPKATDAPKADAPKTDSATDAPKADAATDAPPADEPVYTANIVSITFTGAPIADDYQAKVLFEELTNSKINFTWISNSNYSEQFGTMMASGTMPAIVTLTGLDANVVKYIRAGAFWDITDAYKDYNYLANMDPVTASNISIDGRIYGIPRTRQVGRNGITYRQDWAEKAGVGEPKTIEDVEKLLDFFTNGDPDGDGQNNTYGITFCKYDGPLDIISTWFGAGNQWVDQGGKLIPYFETQGYVDAMNWIKSMYDKGYINSDFASRDTAIWADDINSSRSGMHIDVSDQAQRTDAALVQLDAAKYTDATWVTGHVSTSAGTFNLPTNGYSGLLAISKSGAKTEADMRAALNFLNKTNSEECMDIFAYGMPGYHYNIEDGYVVRVTLPDTESTSNIMDGFNQFMTGVGGQGHAEKRSPIRQRVWELQYQIEPEFCVTNPAITFPVSSEVYQDYGADLDQLRKDARINYIIGEISWDEYQNQIKEWYSIGGQELVDQYNELYKK